MSAGVAPDLVRAREVVASRGGRIGAPLTILDETESTNDDAKRGAREGAPHGAVWLAESQTRGRGRQGRVWSSPRGENLLFSVLLRVSCAPSRVPPLALVAGLAVRDAVARVLGDERVLVKWPNDVVIDDGGGRLRKLAGILVESSLMGSRVEHVVVGIGINVHTRELPDELRAIATSVAIEGGVGDRVEILADVLASLDHDVEHVAHRGLGILHARLTKYDALLGRSVEGGIASGIDPDGRLLVRRDDGSIERIVSGEVRVAG